jgi:hypothetical protein
MTSTIRSTTTPLATSRVPLTRRPAVRSRAPRRGRSAERQPCPPRPTRSARRLLERYLDSRGRSREVIAEPGSGGSVLVIDRDPLALADSRLVAHLAADEPASNAELIVRSYLEALHADRWRCRRVADRDFLEIPFAEVGRHELEDAHASVAAICHSTRCLADRFGREYRLVLLSTGMSIPEARWCRGASIASRTSEPVSLREAIGALQAYEPICRATEDVVSHGRDDEAVSIAALRAELARVRESPIVLNRGLREAVRATVEHGALSLSEIAMRCGRIKRDGAGNLSGETSWLARRLGMMPEGGRATPTPWVHSDVLALIAREGLGVSPREVEAV